MYRRCREKIETGRPVDARDSADTSEVIVMTPTEVKKLLAEEPILSMSELDKSMEFFNRTGRDRRDRWTRWHERCKAAGLKFEFVVGQ